MAEKPISTRASLLKQTEDLIKQQGLTSIVGTPEFPDFGLIGDRYRQQDLDTFNKAVLEGKATTSFIKNMNQDIAKREKAFKILEELAPRAEIEESLLGKPSKELQLRRDPQKIVQAGLREGRATQEIQQGLEPSEETKLRQALKKRELKKEVTKRSQPSQQEVFEEELRKAREEGFLLGKAEELEKARKVAFESALPQDDTTGKQFLNSLLKSTLQRAGPEVLSFGPLGFSSKQDQAQATSAAPAQTPVIPAAQPQFVKIKTPAGQSGRIPQHKLQQALDAGATVIPTEEASTPLGGLS